MKDFQLLFSTCLKTAVKSIASITAIRLASFIFVIGCFFAGAYYIFFRIFGYLMTVEIIGTALMDRVFEMAFFVFFVILLFSNVITSFSTFYNNKELNLLFSLPIRPTSIYLAKLFENCIYASWATMVIALPLVVAYGVTMRAQFVYYPISIISILIYLIIPATIASLFVVLIFRLFPQLKSRDVILISLALIMGLTFMYMKMNNPQLLKIFETENERELLRYAANLTTVGGAYVPSTWLSNALKGLGLNVMHGFSYFQLLLSVSISTVIIAFFVAKALYVQSWLLVGSHEKKRRRKKSLLSPYQTDAVEAFLFKDILTFIREPTQWAQLSIFVILLTVYIFSLRKTPIYFTFPMWRTIVSFANFAYISFVLATLGVRFIFPAISLERAGIWVLGSSPFSFKKIIRIKYLSNLLTAVIIMEALLIFSNIFLRTDQRMYLAMPIIALFFAASLVSINLGFGCRFPQFNEDNPSKIAAGSGGIMAALASITYVAVSIIILSTPAYSYLTNKYYNRSSNELTVYAALIIFLILNTITIIVPLRLGIKFLEKRDF